MQESSRELAAPFQALLDQIPEALARDDLPAAEDLANRAMAWGRRHGDQDAIDRARCNLIGFSLVRQDADPRAASSLQRILMRGRNLGTCFHAAYYLSLLNDQRRRYDKSLFYGRLALEHAKQADNPSWMIKAWNRIGNVQIVQSLFREACETYHRVLPLLGSGPGSDHAVIGANVGYCLLMLEQHRDGLRHLIETRRLIRRLRTPHLEARIGLRLSFCYAYIELGRPDIAHRHGEAALAQGEATNDPGLTEKALYLLGEVAKKNGDEERAFLYFERLENTYHPEQVGLADLLMAVESHRLVNLRA